MTLRIGETAPDFEADSTCWTPKLFEDPLIVAADVQTAWARRRKIDLPELLDASWILTGPDTWVYRSVAEAFHAQGLSMPRVGLVAPSALLRANLLGMGPFVTALPSSVLYLGNANRSLKALPISLHIRGYGRRRDVSRHDLACRAFVQFISAAGGEVGLSPNGGVVLLEWEASADKSCAPMRYGSIIILSWFCVSQSSQP